MLEAVLFELSCVEVKSLFLSLGEISGLSVRGTGLGTACDKIRMVVESVHLEADAYMVCLTHALSTEREEVMGLLIGEVIMGNGVLT